MHELLKYLGGGLGAVILSAAARALPPPIPMGSRLYLWFYNFAGILLSNYDKVKG